jgi:hypothetical protein
MKCMLCPATIDETKAFHAEHVSDQRAHALALEAWQQLTVNIGNREVISGHVCPNEVTVELKKVGVK